MDGYDSQVYETTTTVDPSAAAAAAGVFFAALVFMLLFALVVYVIQAIFLGLIFKKANVASWKAWVPIYNAWITLELGKQSGWWSILLLVPVVNVVALVFYYIAMYHIGLKLQKEGWFVLLAIFIPLVWLIWLALDKSTWEGQSAVEQQPPTTPQPVV